MTSDEYTADTQPVSAARLAAKLGHFTNIQRAEVQLPYRILLRVGDDGMCRTELKTIREYGWMVSGFTMGSNSVSVVREDSGGGRHV